MPDPGQQLPDWLMKGRELLSLADTPEERAADLAELDKRGAVEFPDWAQRRETLLEEGWQGPPMSAAGPPPPPPERYLEKRYEPVDPVGLGNLQSYWYDKARDKDEPEADYNARTDREWMEEVNRAREGDYRVSRYRDTEGLEAIAAGIFPLAMSAVMGQSRGRTMGIADWAGGKVDPEAYKNMQMVADGQIEAPGAQMMAGVNELFGALSPSSISSHVVGPIMKAAGFGKATGRGAAAVAGQMGRGVVGGAAAGAADGTARVATDAAMRAADDRPQRTAGDMGAEVGLSTAGGGLFGMFAPLVARAAGWGVDRLRETADLGPQLANAERAGVQTGMFGLNPPPSMREARQLQARPRPEPKDQLADPSLAEHGMSAAEISARRGGNEVLKAFKPYREHTAERITAEREPYYDSPEGMTEVSLEPAIAALQKRIKAGTDWEGRPLTGYDTYDADMKLLGSLQEGTFRERGQEFDPDISIPTHEARNRGIPLDEPALQKRAAELVDRQQVMTNPGQATMASHGKPFTAIERPDIPEYKSIKEMRYVEPEEGALVERNGSYEFNEEQLLRNQQRGLEGGGQVELRPRMTNARKLDRSIAEYTDTVGNKRQVGTKHASEDLVQAELLKLRQQFAANQHAPEGFAAHGERWHQDMIHLENLAENIGLDRKINVVRLDDPVLQEKVFEFARNNRKAGVRGGERGEELLELLAANPRAERGLDVAAGHRDMDAINRLEPPMQVVGGQRGPIGKSAQWLALHADPALQATAGVERTNMAARKQLPGNIEDTRSYKAGQSELGRTTAHIVSAPYRAVRQALRGQPVPENPVRDQLEPASEMGARAVVPRPKGQTPNDPTRLKQRYDEATNYYPDKTHGNGVAASRAGRAAAVGADLDEDREADMQWLLEALESLQGNKR